MTEQIQRWEERHKEDDILPIKTTANEIMMEAIRNKSGKETLDFLKEMFQLEKERDAENARKAYFRAKSAFKAHAPVVIKDMDNKQYNSKYASENAMLNTINPVLSQFGLEACFDFPKVEQGMAVTCILTHELGHSERVTLPGPLDTSGSKNPLQQVKSTVTYLRKATFEAIVGIASSNGVDDDANSAAPEDTINDQQFADITSLISEVKANEKAFLKYLKIESLDKMPASLYERAMKELERKRK